MAFVLAALAFGFIIAFHEFGHMWVAKRLGMRVERFSIGFGPVIFARTVGETEYALSAIPLGGYVKIAGMSTEDEVDPEDPRNFVNRPAWARLLAIAAGPAANYLLAFAIGVPLLMAANMRVDPGSTVVGDVAPGEAAAVAGIRTGDDLRDVGGKPVHDFAEIREAIQGAQQARPGEAVVINALRDGSPIVFSVRPRDAGGVWLVGIGPHKKVAPGLPLIEALPQAFVNLLDASRDSLSNVVKLVTGNASVKQLSGPVGMIRMTAAQAEKGLLDYLHTVWALNVAVGFFNLLPIPSLDGARVLFLAYETVARRRVNQKVEGVIHTVGLVALLALIAFVSYGDIVRKFRGG
jgi:regulator of sigma E protease